MPASITDPEHLTGWTEIFRAGVRRGEPYSESDLDDIIHNFRRFRQQLTPPSVIGHSEDQSWLEDTGLPSVGKVADLRRRGPVLEARFARMPPLMRRLIAVGAYDKVSAEIYHEDSPPEGIPAKGKMLRRVAFLGGELPQVKGLKDIAALWEQPDQPGKDVKRRTSLSYSERFHLPDGTWAVFSEVRTMADQSGVEAIAVAAIQETFPGLPPEFIDSLTPDQMSMLAPAIGGGTEEGGEPGVPPDMGGSTGESTPMAEFPPEAPDRDSLIQALVDLGQNADDLANMSDDDLVALYQQLKGTSMSEGGTDVADTQTGGLARQPSKVTVTQQFSEEVRKEVKRLVAAETASLRQSVERERKTRLQAARANHLATVRTFCEQMVTEGRLSPAEAEFGKDGQPVGPVAKRLFRADSVRKFSEGKTEFELQADEIKQRQARKFSEKVPAPNQQQGGGLSPERRAELLGYTGVGRTILREESRSRKN